MVFLPRPMDLNASMNAGSWCFVLSSDLSVKARWQVVFSGCKKTELFSVFDKNRASELNEVKTSKIRLAKFLKTRSLLSVNDCFKNEHNAIFGVFLQRLDNNSH